MHLQIRYRAEYAAAWTILKALGLLPRPVAHSCAAILSRVLYWGTPGLRAVADQNLKMALPRLASQERIAICRGVYRSLSRLLAESARFPRLNASNIGELMRCDGLEHYKAAVSQKRGVLFLTAHLGAWELGAFAHALYGYPLYVLYRPLDNPLLDRLVNTYRTLSGNTLINKNESARGMLAALQRNGTIGILADQNTLPEEGVFVDFFGVPASTTAGIAKIALRTGAAVVPAFCLWHSQEKRFRIHFHEPLRLEQTGNTQQDVRAATQQMTSVIEEYVRQYPDQWLWIHRRWKTRPPGEPPLY
ncbi:MAG: lysophospholipid acyltransferase family protein [Acidobacteria bacterium]|nr:lysophospholipid acyltransferase family protein [Acidobacteriota bacterium]